FTHGHLPPPLSAEPAQPGVLVGIDQRGDACIADPLRDRDSLSVLFTLHSALRDVVRPYRFDTKATIPDRSAIRKGAHPRSRMWTRLRLRAGILLRRNAT